MGLVDMPFEIANVQIENPEAAAHARLGWFRSVSNIPHAFAIQSMVGELAAATNRDQKEMLLRADRLAAHPQPRLREGPVELRRAG